MVYIGEKIIQHKMGNNKDKIIGVAIMLVGLGIMVGYIFWGPMDLYYSTHGYPDALVDLYAINGFSWTWAVVLPLTLIVVVVGLLAAWIGYSMMTTPPPVPLEELEEELEAEEAASAAGKDE